MLVWVNGKPGSRKFIFKGSSLAGTPIVILGHDQDAYGGGFNQNDAFIGQLTDVHMWDHVIAPCEINNFSENKKFQGGNLINWEALSYTTSAMERLVTIFLLACSCFAIPQAELNSWNSVCATWDSITGLSQVWVNGKPGSRKFIFKGGSLAGTPIIVIGHDQDSYGGGFNKDEALIGQLTDVHMWDHVIAPCEINNFSENKKFQGGNLINWQAVNYAMYGNVVVENQINVNVQQDCDLAWMHGN
ncbi:hypothetical protein ACEWY4_017670 [Coilia grayii]|uniref:Pentraxin family member n=1 Tax=Coilia grayii TaxID=363190 RepID=A0ABD1JIP0_9TELE